MKQAQELIKFIDKSYTPFHVVENAKLMLQEKGFAYISNDLRNIELGKKYFTIYNDSMIIAFTTPTSKENVEMHIVASHSDSPSFKLKPNFIMPDANYLKFNTEPYGGGIYSTFMDRLLGIAGRVIEKEDNKLVTKLVNFKEDILIPNVAIHMNRDANTGLNLNPQIDMLPMVSLNKEYKLLFDNVVSHDLFIYNKEKGVIWGPDKEFISSPRLDDLECAYSSLVAISKQDENSFLNVAVIFNHEEVGSRSSVGAASNYFETLLKKIFEKLSLSDFEESMKNSLIVSADNAHAIHPNHPEYSDRTNVPVMNGGIVIKHQAGLSYTTDAISEAVFKNVCENVNVPTQSFTNRSDKRGGGTLGSILLGSLSIPSVDIGLAQLAMHSSYETAGTKDVEYLIKALDNFFQTELKVNNIFINK